MATWASHLTKPSGLSLLSSSQRHGLIIVFSLIPLNHLGKVPSAGGDPAGPCVLAVAAVPVPPQDRNAMEVAWGPLPCWAALAETGKLKQLRFWPSISQCGKCSQARSCPRDCLCLEYAGIPPLPFPAPRLGGGKRSTTRHRRESPGGSGRAAAGSVLPEQSPGVQAMLTRPVGMSMGWISHEEPPSPPAQFILKLTTASPSLLQG